MTAHRDRRYLALSACLLLASTVLTVWLLVEAAVALWRMPIAGWLALTATALTATIALLVAAQRRITRLSAALAVTTVELADARDRLRAITRLSVARRGEPSVRPMRVGEW